MTKLYHFKDGDHWVTCQRCGKVVRSSKIRKEWTGLWVCPEDWEPRHPQDFVRAKKDKQSVFPSLPEQTDSFVFKQCTTRTSVAGIALAGCAISGLDTDYNEIPSGTFNTNTL